MNEVLTTFKALSDATRLRIVKLLEHRDLCVCDIVAALAMVQPKVSFHLGVLKGAGLLKDRKQGRWIHYAIDDSEMFKRLLIFSVMEKIPEATMRDDKRRLQEFLKSKNEGVVTPVNETCCERR